MSWPFPAKLLWGENPSYYDTATMGKYWRYVKNGAVSSSGGYGGGAALTFDESTGFSTGGTSPMDPDDPNIATIFPGDSSNGGTATRVSDTRHVHAGSRCYIGAAPGSTQMLYGILNAAGKVQAQLALEPDLTISVYAGYGAGATLRKNLSDVVLSFGWHRLCFLGAISNFDGWVDMYVDSVNYAYVPMIRTFADDDFAWRGVGFSGTEDIRHSHMFLREGVPEYGDPFRRGGFQVLDLGGPVSDATYLEWVSTEATLADAIDEAPPDDTDKVTSLVAGNAFSVLHDELPITRAIYGAMLSQRYERSADDAVLRPMVVSGGARFSTVTGGGSSAVDVVRGLWTTNPRTGSSWTRGAINASEWGALS